jgi:uncharacterized BrkB/YihY/UPF0761 family membrane protein
MVGEVSRAQALRERKERVLDDVHAARERSRTIDAAFDVYDRDQRSVGGVLAGAIAFRVFVFMLPLCLCVVALLGVFGAVDEDSPGEVADSLGISSYVVDSIETASAQSQDSLLLLAPVALWAVYLTGSGLARVVWALHALAWEQPMSRPRSRLKSAGAAIVVALAALAIIAISQLARSYSEGLGLGAALLTIVPFAALWITTSRLLPHDPAAPLLAHVPGALFVGTGVWLANLVSTLYLVHKITSSSELYGSIGIAAAMLAWLYLLGRLMVGSAMLNATLWARRHPVTP